MRGLHILSAIASATVLFVNGCATDTEPATENVTETHATSASVTFELVNKTGQVIYAKHERSDDPTQFWLKVRHDQNHVAFVDLPNVPICPEQGGASDLLGRVSQDNTGLSPGESRRATWDGTGWLQKRFCEEFHRFHGKTLEAEFCYGYGITQKTNMITNITCKTVPFTVTDRPQTVRVEVKPRQPNAIIVRMINGTERTIYAGPAGRTTHPMCHGPWYRIKGAGIFAYKLRPPCEDMCTCREIQASATDQCRETCPPSPDCPSTTRDDLRLEPGEARSETWGGYIYVERQGEQDSCQARIAVPPEPLTVRFCYANGVQRRHGEVALDGRECETRTFQPSNTSLVEFVIR